MSNPRLLLLLNHSRHGREDSAGDQAMSLFGKWCFRHGLYFSFLGFFFILGDSLETAALKQSCGKAAGEQTFPLFGAKAAAVEMWARAPEHPSESIQGRSHYS